MRCKAGLLARNNDISTPSEPVSVTANTGSYNDGFDVEFFPPLSSGRSSITNFVLEWTSNDGATWNAYSTYGGPYWTLQSGGEYYDYIFLPNSLTTTYKIRIAAENSFGRGPWSEIVQAVPY